MTAIFNGVATAIATTMNNDGSIDYAAYERLVEFQISSGINGIIVAGTTGEGATLTIEEKLDLLRRTIRIRGDRDCAIILGTGSNNTLTAIDHTRLAKENGADAALVVTPFYNKTSQRGLVAHYFAIADSVDIPIILYNVPGRTGMTINPETVAELAGHRNIVALKDATGDIGYLDRVRGYLEPNTDFNLYSGDDGSFFDFLVHGGDGVISVVSNCLPVEFLRVYSLYQEGRINEARDLQLDLNPFIGALFSDVSPTPVKAVLKEMGYGEENFRLPLIPTTDAVRENTIALYRECLSLEA